MIYLSRIRRSILITILLLVGTPAICSEDIITSLQDVSMVLGDGYDANHRLLRKRCISGQLEYSGESKLEVNMERSLTLEEFSSKMSISGKIGLDLGFIGGSVKATASASLLDKSYHETLIFNVEAKGKRAILTRFELTQLGRELVERGDKGEIQLNCGNRVLTEAELGGQLFIFVTFESNDKEILQEFVAKFKIKLLGLKKTKTIKRKNSVYSKKVRLHINTLQIGGDPRRLKGLEEGAKNSCEIGKTELCHKLIDRLYNYAVSDSGFRSQLNDMKYSLQRREGNSAIAYKAVNYQEIDIQSLVTGNPEYFDLANQTAYGFLTREKTSLLSDLNQVSSILSDTPLMKKDRYKYLDSHSELTRSLVEAERAIRECYRQPGRCKDFYQELKARVYKIDEDDLFVRYKFYQFCELAQEGHFMWQVRQKLFSLLDASSCEQAWNQRARVLSLELSDLGIDSVKFLSEFSSIRSLDLSGNSIESIFPLKDMVNLSKIKLSHNKVSSLKHLIGLPSIKQINAAYNYVDQVVVPERSKLKKLSLHGNPLVSIDLDQGNFSDLFLDELEVCDFLVSDAYSKGQISRFQRSLWIESEFSPVYNDPLDRDSGVEGMYECSYSAKFFDIEF